MRLHRNLVFTVIDNLYILFNEEEYADQVISKSLKKDKRWGARDRDFIAATTYEIIRYKRLYNEIAETKNHFTRDNLWKIFAVWAVLRGIPLPDWKHFENTPKRKIKGRFDQLKKTRKIRESIPDWLDLLCEKELGKKVWDKELKHLNEPAKVVLRVNTLKINRIDLQKELAQKEIGTLTEDAYPDALILEERKNVFQTEAFAMGFFEIQDACSQLVAEYLAVREGMRVVDACAGAGGKTLHLASLMKNKGQIIALDVYEYKLKELKKRAKRAGTHNITTKVITHSKTIKKLYNSADRVLIDAPCSGIGILKRRPNDKWKLSADFIEKVKNLQKKLLQSYSKILKKGGKMVYATCSILSSENEKQIRYFLENNPNFTLEKEQTMYPSQSGFDGFYMALLTKNNFVKM